MESKVKPEKILIISRRPEIYSNQRLVQELDHKNVPCEIINPEMAELGEASVGLVRLASWRFQAALENLQRFAEKIPMVNSLESFQKSRNKWLCLQALCKNNIPTPLTQMISRQEFEFIDLTFPFVLKELFSTQGLGVYLIKSKNELEQALKMNPDTDLFLVQNYIHECHGQDLRLFVTRKGDAWAMRRTNSTGDLRSNIHCGGVAKKETAQPEELEMAFKALKIFELDYAGVDILRSNEGPLMIEVNPAPGFEGLETVHGPHIAGPLIDLILARI